MTLDKMAGKMAAENMRLWLDPEAYHTAFLGCVNDGKVSSTIRWKCTHFQNKNVYGESSLGAVEFCNPSFFKVETQSTTFSIKFQSSFPNPAPIV